MNKPIRALWALMIICVLLLTCACGGSPDNGGDAEEGGAEEGGNGSSENGGGDSTPDVDGLLINSSSTVYLITTADSDRNLLARLREAITEATGATVRQAGATSDAHECEIILGNTERPASALAEKELKKLTRVDPYDMRTVIYACDNTLAFSYDSVDENGFKTNPLSVMVDEFISEYLNAEIDSLEFDRGTVASGMTDVRTVLSIAAQPDIDAAWQRVENALSKYEGGEKTLAALKDYYDLLDPDVALWFAGLYDVDIGGFYYSNSARDNAPHRPDAESTSQALSFISASGLASANGGSYATALPDWMKADIVKFIKGLQDPNGFFYHPQWSKELTDTKLSRRSRDLSSCVGILSALGSAPTYDTPTGVKGDGILADGTPVALTTPLGVSRATAVSKVTAVSHSEHLEDDTAFMNYLDGLQIKYGGGYYAIGNELSSQVGLIKSRDEELKKEGADYSLVEILINWLNERQNPTTGAWGNDSSYDSVNALLKIVNIYHNVSTLMPNAEAAAHTALAAVLSPVKPDKVVDVYNTWYAVQIILKNVTSFGNGAELAEELRASVIAKGDVYISKTREKLEIFQKDDCSFSYYPEYAAFESQGMLVAEKYVNEGDVNATIISTTGTRNMIFLSLGIPYVPFCTEADFFEFMRIIQN